LLFTLWLIIYPYCNKELEASSSAYVIINPYQFVPSGGQYAVPDGIIALASGDIFVKTSFPIIGGHSEIIKSYYKICLLSH